MNDYLFKIRIALLSIFQILFNNLIHSKDNPVLGKNEDDHSNYQISFASQLMFVRNRTSNLNELNEI